MPGLIHFFMLATAIALVVTPRLIHSLIALCIFSSLLTLQYVFLRAPDVAITEAALGAGLSTLIYLTAIRKTATGKTEPADGAPMHSEPQEESRMITLPDVLTPQNIHLLTARKRDQIIRELLQYCLHDKEPAFVQSVLHEVLVKKRSASPLDMSLGRGFALIHARRNDCEDVSVAVGLLREPLNLYRGEKIHTLIGIVLPSSQSRQYLTFLARFGRLMHAPETSIQFKEAGKLLAAGEEDEAKQNLSEFIRTFEEA